MAAITGKWHGCHFKKYVVVGEIHTQPSICNQICMQPFMLGKFACVRMLCPQMLVDGVWEKLINYFLSFLQKFKNILCLDSN